LDPLCLLSPLYSLPPGAACQVFQFIEYLFEYISTNFLPYSK
jgi:hypothetical protein